MLQGFGEKGPEAALPLNAKTLGMIGEGIAATMQGFGSTPIILQIDGKTIAETTLDRTDQLLSGKSRARNYGVGRRE